MPTTQISGTLFGTVRHRNWKMADKGEQIPGHNDIAQYGGKHILTREDLDLLGIRSNLTVPLTLIGMHNQGFKIVVILEGGDVQRGRVRIVRELDWDKFTEQSMRSGNAVHAR